MNTQSHFLAFWFVHLGFLLNAEFVFFIFHVFCPSYFEPHRTCVSFIFLLTEHYRHFKDDNNNNNDQTHTEIISKKTYLILCASTTISSLQQNCVHISIFIWCCFNFIFINVLFECEN